MLTMTSYIQDYVVENAEVFNEFDRSNFIANAAIMLDKLSTNISLSVKGNQYSHLLDKTVSHINTIEIDSYAVSEFISKILNAGRINMIAGLYMKDISKMDTIAVKPQYLTEAILDYKETVNGIASGKYNEDKIRSLYNNIDNYIVALKKRLVSSNINVNITPKEMLKYDDFENVKVTTAYLEDIVIPFLQDIPKHKKELSVEISNVSSVVDGALADLKRLMENVSAGISMDKIDGVKKKLMLQYTYNQVRAILEGISYLTYAVMRNAHQFEECVVECQNVYNTLTRVFNDAMNIVESGAFDNKVISASDANNMAEKLAEGGNDIFDELSHNIMEYHRGYIASHITDITDISGGDVESYLVTLLSDKEYNPTVYHDLVKAYIEIGNGLDILAKNCDDYLAIFSDLLEKAGFILSLSDRFHNEIDALNNLSEYGITDINIEGSAKKEVYYRILAEINDYPELTKQIARGANAIQTKAEYVEELFNHKKNGELAYSETMNELKIFVDSFKDQFRAMNNAIVKGLFLRLKRLAAKADECLDDEYSTPENIYYDSDDFFKEAVLANLKEIDRNNDVIMEVLLREYYIERGFKERGVRLVYEAENDTTVKVVDNDATTSTTTSKVGGTSIKNLLTSIGEWFEKMIESFTDVIGRQKVKNSAWLNNNKNALTTRSYSNVEIQILPYDNMPSAQIANDIAKLTTNIGTMNIQNITNIGSYEDLRTRLINFGPKFNDNDEKIAITNYYKVGNKPLQTVTYANSDIKNKVSDTIIPYCESFYDSYCDDIKKRLTDLKNAAENIVKTYVTESNNVVDNAPIFTEAEADTQAQTNTENKTTADVGLSAKAGWIKRCVQVYSGSVLNAIRDRNNDYFKVLYALAPKQTAANEPKANEGTNEPTEDSAK